MHSCHFRRLIIPRFWSNHCPNVILLPVTGCAVEYTQCLSIALQMSNNLCLMKGSFPACQSVSWVPIGRCFRTLRSSVRSGDKSGIQYSDYGHLNEEIQLDARDDLSDPLEVVAGSKEKGQRQRRKHGNTGKVPWNKGVKHSEETRALIRRRTIDALRDPQVKKRMSGHGCPHSDENKAKISAALRQVWYKRLKCKRMRERVYELWAYSIAEAARKGGTDQQELDWDSYDKLVLEISLHHLQKKEQTVSSSAKKTVENGIGKAQRQKEKEEKAKARAEAERDSRKKSKKRAEEFSATKESSLKQMLKEIRQKKATEQVSILHREASIFPCAAWKKLDKELTRRDVVSEVSLADQIKAAKCRRAESMA